MYDIYITAFAFLCLCGIFWLIRDHTDTIASYFLFAVVAGFAFFALIDALHFLGLVDAPSGLGIGDGHGRY